MTDYVNEFFRLTKNEQIRPHLVMNDGTSISVQASNYHHCTPRERNLDYYSAVEVWAFPYDETFFVEWGGNNDTPATYVPIEHVNKYIEIHGGCKRLAIDVKTDQQTKTNTQKNRQNLLASCGRKENFVNQDGQRT